MSMKFLFSKGPWKRDEINPAKVIVPACTDEKVAIANAILIAEAPVTFQYLAELMEELEGESLPTSLNETLLKINNHIKKSGLVESGLAIATLNVTPS